ncbi:MAG: M50 family metallopeptidase, partial [Candidatus Baltobacteraceae bacterium]
MSLIPIAMFGKILTFLIMLSILVVLHELGHFVIARRNGVRVNEFALGMGPKIFGYTSPRSGTLYSVRALPIGGYCAMLGEDGTRTQAEQQREFRDGQQAEDGDFQSKAPLARLAIVLAGPIVNFLLAYVILFIGIAAFGVASSKPNTVVALVESGSPAQRAGILPGDKIVSVDGVSYSSGTALVKRLHASLGKTLHIGFLHDGTMLVRTAVPAPCPTNPRDGCIGIEASVPYERVGLKDAFIDAGYTYGLIAAQSVGSIEKLVTHFTKYAGQVSGPIGIGRAA